jgi:hypothetical protein
VCFSTGEATLHVLVLLICRTTGARGRLRLDQGVIILRLGTMDAFLEDGLGFVDLKLSLEVMKVVGVSAAVGSAASIGPLELLINDFLTGAAPVNNISWLDVTEAKLVQMAEMVMIHWLLPPKRMVMSRHLQVRRRELTNCPDHRRSSWSSWDQHQRSHAGRRIWEDYPEGRQCLQQCQRGPSR